MTRVLYVHLDDLNPEFIQDLKREFGKNAEVEIRLRETSPADELLSDADFWKVIDHINWSEQTAEDQLFPSIKVLSEMPVASIYLFVDKLSEKLYKLDTRAHAQAYLEGEPEDYLSVDDFLYVRCAVVAEGREYYERVLAHPEEMPNEITFEPLLNLADEAYERKTEKTLDYQPAWNYETFSNSEGWK